VQVESHFSPAGPSTKVCRVFADKAAGPSLAAWRVQKKHGTV